MELLMDNLTSDQRNVTLDMNPEVIQQSTTEWFNRSLSKSAS